MKLWSISTTLRNPYRFKDFLAVLKEFEGDIWDKEAQKNFQIKLIQNRMYGLSNQFVNTLPDDLASIFTDFSQPLTFEVAKQIFNSKKYVDPSMRGRTSFKPLEKFGAVKLTQRKKIKFTELGNWILSDNFDIEEFWLKALLKWQYSNPNDREFKDFNIKPFVATLHLIKNVNEICASSGITEKGISFKEFEIFALSLNNYEKIYQNAEELVKLRIEADKISDFKQKEKFYEEYKEEFLKDYTNKQHSHDYADNAIRYFRLTSLIYLRGGGFYIDINQYKKYDILELLSEDNAQKINFRDRNEYIEYLADLSLPELPWDRDSEVLYLKNQIDRISKQLNKTINYENLTKQQLKTILKELKFELNKSIYTNTQKIDEIIENLKNYRKHPTLKPSIALEKFVTEALLALNDAIKIKPNYISGDNNDIIFTAPANTPDIECYYNDFYSLCEVTNLTSRDQWYNEGQPVMRHLRDFEDANNDKSTYCLFIAPKLHRDTINTYWTAVKYEYEGQPQKIVPMSISQFTELLKILKELKEKNFFLNHQKLKELYDEIIAQTEKVRNSEEWIKSIPEVIKKWKKSLVA